MSDAGDASGAADAALVKATISRAAAAMSSLLRGEAEASGAPERAAGVAQLGAAVAGLRLYVKLDVGGAAFKTTASTLCAERGSLLAALVSSPGFSAKLDDSGAYFIDRDGTHFRHVLNYLRGCFDASLLAETARRELMVEADFYGLQGLVHALTVRALPFNGVSGDEHGLMHWLGTARGTNHPRWSNPAESGAVRVASTSRPGLNTKVSLYGMVGRGPPSWKPQEGGHIHGELHGAFILIELLDGVSIEPTHYSLRLASPEYCDQNSSTYKWTLEAATHLDGPFVALKQHAAPGGDLQAGITAWALEPLPSSAQGVAFSVFRLAVQKGCLHVACFEVYGTAYVR